MNEKALNIDMTEIRVPNLDHLFRDLLESKKYGTGRLGTVPVPNSYHG